MHVQAEIGSDAAAAFSGLASASGLSSVDITGSGTPETLVAPVGDRSLDGYSRVMHNRWNRDLLAAVSVRPGEEVELLCRDALDIGDQAKTMTADGTMTIDLGRIHPLTGPIHVEGAEPGDILEVEILDVSPLVDFGYVTISPALGLFGTLRPEALAALARIRRRPNSAIPVRAGCRRRSPRISPTTAARRRLGYFGSSGVRIPASPRSSVPTPGGRHGSRSPRSWASLAMRHFGGACTGRSRQV
jgi:hypothetical protein